MIDIGRYLDRIGFDGVPDASLPTLARLLECHARAIPFENIEVLAGRVPKLDLAALQAKMVARRRGGYCFEQNTLFMGVLGHLGFTVRGLEGRVRAGVPAEVLTARTHMALCVTIGGQDHLADVGFGALAPMAPLKFGVGSEEQRAGTGVYRFVDAPRGDLLLQAQAHEGWTDCYLIAPSQPQAIDYEMGNWWVATHPTGMLRSNLLLARAVDGGRMTLFNRQLSIRRPQTAAPEERTLTDRAEIADVMADGFGLEVEAADFDAVMAVLEQKD